MKKLKLMTWVAIALIGWNSASAAPQRTPDPPEWTTPIAPFHIAGNLYYVDPEGYQAAVAERETAFQDELKKQQSTT
jgi:hypothetical protein